MKVSAETLRLYAVTDSTWLKGRSLTEVVRESIEGGATIVQYREKVKSYDEQLEECMALCALCKEYGVPFIVNDDVQLAKAVDADGVHLGLDDGDLKEARRILGEGKIIGASSHNKDEAMAAEAQGVDYLGCGAVFGSSTKANAQCISPEILREAAESVSIPMVAIGGISRSNIEKLNGCGLAGVAVISAIFAQDDIKAASQEMFRLAGEL